MTVGHGASATLGRHQTLQEAVQLLAAHGIDAVDVVDEYGRTVGRCTWRMVLRAVADGMDRAMTVEDVLAVFSLEGETEKRNARSETPDAEDDSGAAAELERLRGELEETHRLAETMKTVLDAAYEGVVVVDGNGVIREINRAYCQFLGIRREDAIGKHVTEVIENTRLHICVQSGIPERGYIQKIYGQPMVVHRIPIWRDGEVIGAIGMLIFQGVSEVYEIFRRLQELSREASRKEKNGAAAPKQEAATSAAVGVERIIGRHPTIAAVKQMIRRAARVPSTVLITGESGTGKEVAARAIHEAGPHADGPFVSVNCAAIPEALLEAELFGYEDGAFTGAKKGGKPGKFQLAHRGTLFLDEIGDMPLAMQAKILRVLEEKKVEKVGGLSETEVDVRIIAATNKPLEEMVRGGTFREDLFYRLNIIRIHLPPLRERKTDIPALLAYHMERLCRQFGVTTKSFAKEAMEVLISYSWPGNIRELVNVVEWLISMVEGENIEREHLPAYLSAIQPMAASMQYGGVNIADRWKEMVYQSERERIAAALVAANGNKAEAARRLGIHRSTLYEKLKKYGF
ncbi:sigma 54-interacting transcriptional regulator [Geobacillus subterraneus]|uniref:sigma 54-interacting transcriptional regulator n=1 Tax=Geobacillus subterraneus TaxID=129338 RepID=UPI001442B22D|nr:sigma 54-interacting transcriptional regulator [Geobacillus subterraneus]QIZ67967.1 sigma 54-interacting transcriptional regulator [Geobacillus subterraneus]WPZ16967.1 sigma 54-interacting transcriptional regulator [Geobacillus subterraneus]